MYDVTLPVEPMSETPRAGSSVVGGRRDAAVRPPFPRPSPLFIGRQEDRARCLRLLDRSPLLLTYGVPGVGKTEFVYRLVAELRATPRWQKAQPVLVRAQAGQSIEQLVAVLSFLVHGSRPPRGTRTTAGASWKDELVAVARRLDRTAQLVFLDDVHHLEQAAVAELVSYLARRSGASRLLIASRIELALAAETPPPAVVRLGALSAGEATELARRLAECQGLTPPDEQTIFARTRGCPRLLHQLLQEVPGAGGDDEDALAQTLRKLPPGSRRILVLARILDGKLPVAAWLEAARPLVSEEADLSTLAHHHLVEVGQWTVPDLVWSAIADEIDAEEVADAHKLAARLLLQHGQVATVSRAAAEAALAAVEHQLAGGEPAAAWQTCQRWTRSFQAAELGSRTLGVLPGLRTALPEQRAAINLWAARLLLAEGQLAQALALLDEMGGSGGQQATVRGLLLAGQIAQRSGQLSRAEERFLAAQALATTAGEHLQGRAPPGRAYRAARSRKRRRARPGSSQPHQSDRLPTARSEPRP